MALWGTRRPKHHAHERLRLHHTGKLLAALHIEGVRLIRSRATGRRRRRIGDPPRGEAIITRCRLVAGARSLLSHVSNETS
eukprot:scaffold273524_cov31-Tisochrysis_lutea.AAC.2